MNNFLKLSLLSLLIFSGQCIDASHPQLERSDQWFLALSDSLELTQTIDAPNYQQWENEAKKIKIIRYFNDETAYLEYRAEKIDNDAYFIETFFNNGTSSSHYRNKNNNKKHYLACDLANSARNQFKKCDDNYPGTIKEKP